MRILTLDDMEVRAEAFRRWFVGHEHVHAYTAKEAIQALTGPRFDLVMLDHDLAEEHYAGVNSPGTGMDVVDFIVQQHLHGSCDTPHKAIIHSFNSYRAPLMRSRLAEIGVIAYRIPFGKNPLG